MRKLIITFLITLLVQTVITACNNFPPGKWSNWSADTFKSDAGKCLIINQRRKQIRNKSCSRIEEVRKYYDLCNNLIEKQYTLTELCYRGRLISAKIKNYKSKCTIIPDLNKFRYISSDSISFVHQDSILLINNRKQNTTVFYLKNEFGEKLIQLELVQGQNRELTISHLTWKGVYVLEFEDRTGIIKRDKITQKLKYLKFYY